MTQSEDKPNWERELGIARQQLDVGDTKTISKVVVESEPPERFNHSLLSLPKESKAVYRDKFPEYTLQLREYENEWVIQLDRHNPRNNPIGHLVEDAPKFGATLAVCGAAYFFSRM